MDGVQNTACTLTATAANGTVIANAITAASDAQTTRWFLKRKTGTGPVELTLDNGATWTAVSIDGDYDEYSIYQPALANPQIGIRIVTSGDAVVVGNAEAYTATQKEEVEGLGPIFTAGAIWATDQTLYGYSEENLDNTGLVYCEFYIPQGGPVLVNPSTAIPRIIGFDSSNYLLGIRKTDGNLFARDETNVAQGPAPITTGVNKWALIFHPDDGMQICLNGVYGTLVPYDGTFARPNDLLIGIGADFPFGIRNGEHYQNIASLEEGKAIVDGLMA